MLTHVDCMCLHMLKVCAGVDVDKTRQFLQLFCFAAQRVEEPTITKEQFLQVGHHTPLHAKGNSFIVFLRSANRKWRDIRQRRPPSPGGKKSSLKCA